MLPRRVTTRTITLDELTGPGCYLLHYVSPYLGRPTAPPRHYLGWAKCLGRRITTHARCGGSHFTKACHDAGLAFEVAALWPGGTRCTEKALKRGHHLARLCPLCREEMAAITAVTAATAKATLAAVAAETVATAVATVASLF